MFEIFALSENFPANLVPPLSLCYIDRVYFPAVLSSATILFARNGMAQYSTLATVHWLAPDPIFAVNPPKLAGCSR